MINVNSFQSLGAVDGPGVRFVVFLQGCNIRCRYCHNPETLEIKENQLYTPEELFNKISRYENYIIKDGGVTFSGGEPLLQAKELIPLFEILKSNGYHIVLDTNGTILNDSVKKLLELTDLILLDIKMPTKELYADFTDADILKVIDFFDYACKKDKKIWIRQVVIEGVNDTEENIAFLNKLAENKNVEKIELLPFKKLCVEKYRNLSMEFKMKDFNETSIETINKMKNGLIV